MSKRESAPSIKTTGAMLIKELRMLDVRAAKEKLVAEEAILRIELLEAFNKGYVLEKFEVTDSIKVTVEDMAAFCEDNDVPLKAMLAYETAVLGAKQNGKANVKTAIRLGKAKSTAKPPVGCKITVSQVLKDSSKNIE